MQQANRRPTRGRKPAGGRPRSRKQNEPDHIDGGRQMDSAGTKPICALRRKRDGGKCGCGTEENAN
jgi:hypothetical protein